MAECSANSDRVTLLRGWVAAKLGDTDDATRALWTLQDHKQLWQNPSSVSQFGPLSCHSAAAPPGRGMMGPSLRRGNRMLALLTLLALSPAPQDQVILPIRSPDKIEGAISEADSEVHTTILDRSYTDAAVRGRKVSAGRVAMALAATGSGGSVSPVEPPPLSSAPSHTPATSTTTKMAAIRSGRRLALVSLEESVAQPGSSSIPCLA